MIIDRMFNRMRTDIDEPVFSDYLPMSNTCYGRGVGRRASDIMHGAVSGVIGVTKGTTVPLSCASGPVWSMS